VNLMITVMARREFRDAAGLLPQIGEAAAGLWESVPRAHWLPGLARVLGSHRIPAQAASGIANLLRTELANRSAPSHPREADLKRA
jgi:hypothetical protein